MAALLYGLVLIRQQIETINKSAAEKIQTRLNMTLLSGDRQIPVSGW